MTSTISPPWAYDSNNKELDPKLKAAAGRALQEHVENSSNGGTRTCDANSLCRYWSEDDMNQAENSDPVIIPKLLSDKQLGDILKETSVLGVWPRGEAKAISNNSGEEHDQHNVTVPSDSLKTLAHHQVWTKNHIVLYMHKEDRFRRAHPISWALIRRGMATLSDNRIGKPESELNVRCIELHHYSPGGGLITPGHRDNGSTLTMSILLSDPAGVTGGDFVTYGEGMPMAHNMRRGDAILFQSEKLHNISTVTKGIRQSLVVELWASTENAKGRFE